MSADVVATGAPLDLGWLEVCLPTADFEATTEFFKRVGFIPVGGQPENGWLVMGAGHCEINPMKGLEAVWINFRGADVPALREEMKSRGLSPRDGGNFDPEKWPAELWYTADGAPLPAAGSGDFFLDDPDRNVIYFDTVPIELPRCKAGKPQASPGYDGEWLEGQPRLGSFELLIKVTHLKASKEFYQRLGLEVVGGDSETVLLAGKGGSHTRIRLGQSDVPGFVLLFIGAEERLEEKFLAARLKPMRIDNKLILNSPDGLRLKFLFSAPIPDN